MCMQPKTGKQQGEALEAAAPLKAEREARRAEYGLLSQCSFGERLRAEQEALCQDSEGSKDPYHQIL